MGLVVGGWVNLTCVHPGAMSGILEERDLGRGTARAGGRTLDVGCWKGGWRP